MRQHKTCSGDRKLSLHLQVHDVGICEEKMWLTAWEKVATETKYTYVWFFTLFPDANIYEVFMEVTIHKYRFKIVILLGRRRMISNKFLF
jgi:hypothetical protein